MNRCPICKGNRRDARFEHTLALTDVELVGTVEGTQCDACGETFVTADELERFELLAANAIACKGYVTGETFRVLRKAL